MNNPESVKIDGELYPINTDFRIAIKCNELIMDDSIGDNERGLAIIYLLFGDKGLEAEHHHTKLIELTDKYLSCGKERKETDEEPDMDFVQDMNYIEASFMSDYRIDLSNVEMHWWKFYNLLCSLSNSDFGNCCVLNRIRNIRNCDVSKITDTKEKQRMIELKQEVALKKKEEKLSNEELDSINLFYELNGINRKE